jgi:hypothetical protein
MFNWAAPWRRETEVESSSDECVSRIVRSPGATRAPPLEMAAGMLPPKWLWVAFGGKLGSIVPGQSGNLGFKKRDEGMTFYESES